ncbi:MAG TPA: anti-sigma F factor [Oscillospiraceae bacterium]|nr:anti-sigma F factor [Oscillospiraceae bacterium]HPF55892.1 anti-sigma F factor [Clostridiales bacterium]HPK35017.1 anti-sigma F factor [Oscillospiraceae bacterium]HPR76266.1 anti-sigma F factor [Oscillospiraceae bacterium]
MKVVNRMRLTVPAKSVNESFLRAIAGCFAAQADPPCDLISDVKTAVSEAVTNCIVHAYPNGGGEIIMAAKLTADGMLYIKISDKGRGIPDVKKAMEPLFTTSTGGERSGLGFTVMQQFTDSVSVRSKPGKGTAVTLKKRLIAPEAEKGPGRKGHQGARN